MEVSVVLVSSSLQKKSKDSLNVKLKQPEGVSKSLLRKSLRLNRIIKQLVHSRANHCHAAQRQKTEYGGCVWNYFCCRNRAKTGNMVSKMQVS